MYKLHLILKYLLKRRIAWVSLIAVMLCTTMVLVVISVMGGWLNMFKSSFRGLSGDIVIHAETLKGFPYYQQIIDAVEKDPACKVEAALPSIETAGLYNFGSGPKPVRVMGMNLDEARKVNQFGDSLFRQHNDIVDRLKNPNLAPEERKKLEQKLQQPPSFDLLDQVTTPLDALPSGVNLLPANEGQEGTRQTIALPDSTPRQLKGRLRFDPTKHLLVFHGYMPPEWKELLASLSKDLSYSKAVDDLFTKSHSPDLMEYGPTAGRYYGVIVGTGVIGLHRKEDGTWNRPPDEREWITRTHLTVLDLSGDRVELQNAVTRNFFIVDDSHMGVWQYDSNYIYVPFDMLQRDLGLDAQKVTIDDKEFTKPARVTDIHLKVKPGIDPNEEAQLSAIRQQIETVVQTVFHDQMAAHPQFSAEYPPIVETWQDTQRIWISAVEHEKVLTVMLFGIMCVVAIFLIFCIFYMIVVEKTRDIGIIKSVGATSTGVAQIFLGYGLVIGLIGAGAGWLLSYIIVHNINEMHTWMSNRLHVRIWDPQVYLFDHIPNKMSGQDIAWILPIAILASVLGALIPAIRAARMNPVEALRWE